MEGNTKPDEKKGQKAMDFLPKKESDLATKDYWKSFFEYEAFKGGFEWYADFKDLIPYLKQVITSAD